MSERLRRLIADGRAHVFDGAMGTVLYARGVFVNVCYDELSLTQPRLVLDVHEQYRRAGAEILETNTFGANPVKLAGYGLADRTEEINRTAAGLARKAANGAIAVVGAIGPLGIRIEPFGPTSREEARAFFQRQAAGLLEGGVDGFILETFADLDEIHEALLAVRAVSDLPVIAQMTIGEDGSTAYGTDTETIARSLTAWGADVIGLNCSVGPVAMLDAVERLAAATDRPLSAQPNAGLPRAVGDRRIYLSSPDYMASYARRMVDAGVRFVGGCCGTTPEHIRRIRAVLTANHQPQPVVAATREVLPEPAGGDPVPLQERSQWGRKLATGVFARSIELAPPKGCDAREFLEKCRAIRASGVDAVSLLEGPRSQHRMAVIPAAILALREAGIEPVIHYSCRDRNMLGMISDLLGAAAAGLVNLMITTGDPPRMGPYPDPTAVLDIDSIGLTNLVSRLNRGLDPGGSPTGYPARFVCGVAVDQGAFDAERELSRFAWKVEAGAEFALTYPVFDVSQLERLLERIPAPGIPIIAGIWPLVSVRNAEFLANEVPGLHVPEAVLDRMRTAEASGPDAALEEGIAIARETLAAVRGIVQGVQVGAPGGRVEVGLRVLA